MRFATECAALEALFLLKKAGRGGATGHLVHGKVTCINKCAGQLVKALVLSTAQLQLNALSPSLLLHGARCPSVQARALVEAGGADVHAVDGNGATVLDVASAARSGDRLCSYLRWCMEPGTDVATADQVWGSLMASAEAGAVGNDARAALGSASGGTPVDLPSLLAHMMPPSTAGTDNSEKGAQRMAAWHKARHEEQSGQPPARGVCRLGGQCLALQ